MVNSYWLIIRLRHEERKGARGYEIAQAYI